MGDVVAFKKKSAKTRAKGKTLCSRGFHKWKVDSQRKFDVKQGRLVTVKICTRCGKSKNELT
ncbi:MAG: hypothetical protein K0U93_21465 [Gammaproteobacteria bacterium]|nr:hypothetical protein [Gammaproteobacteria bacterium]